MLPHRSTSWHWEGLFCDVFLSLKSKIIFFCGMKVLYIFTGVDGSSVAGIDLPPVVLFTLMLSISAACSQAGQSGSSRWKQEAMGSCPGQLGWLGWVRIRRHRQDHVKTKQDPVVRPRSLHSLTVKQKTRLWWRRLPKVCLKCFTIISVICFPTFIVISSYHYSSLGSSTKPSFNSKHVFGNTQCKSSITSGRSSASSAKQHYMNKARYMPGELSIDQSESSAFGCRWIL